MHYTVKITFYMANWYSQIRMNHVKRHDYGIDEMNWWNQPIESKLETFYIHQINEMLNWPFQLCLITIFFPFSSFFYSFYTCSIHDVIQTLMIVYNWNCLCRESMEDPFFERINLSMVNYKLYISITLIIIWNFLYYRRISMIYEWIEWMNRILNNDDV